MFQATHQILLYQLAIYQICSKHEGSLKFCEYLLPLRVELVYINFGILRWSLCAVYISCLSLIFTALFLDSNEKLCLISVALLICSQRFRFYTILKLMQFFIFAAVLILLSITVLLFNSSDFPMIHFVF